MMPALLQAPLRLSLAFVLAAIIAPAQTPPVQGGERLRHEKSIHLRQHADDPIQWWPWGEAAFAQAAKEDKPIFLSIGFSSCHWCHIMHEESFKDPKVAEVLNRAFIAIKVDREDRPDVDRIYMEAQQRYGRHGAGWPLSAFLDTARRPFLLGNYYPKTASHGRPGFVQLLTEIESGWQADRKELLASAERITKDLAREQVHDRRESLPDLRTFDRAVFRLLHDEDPKHGGFGDAPKFPRPMAMLFLLREFARTGDERIPLLVTRTLDAMAQSALRDVLLGGWHRYCVEADWTDPHFEKLLEDQAMHAWVYLEAGLALGEPRFKALGEDTLRFCLRALRSKDGGFCSAIDSTAGGVAGAQATWNLAELDRVLDDRGLKLIQAYSGLDTLADRGRRFTLAAKREGALLAEHLKQDEAAVTKELALALAALRTHVAERPTPRRDPKIPLGANALLIQAFCTAARALDEDAWTAEAERTYRFLEQHLMRKDGLAARAFAEGTAIHDGDLTDHAALLMASLSLYELTLNESYLERAKTLGALIMRHFGREDGRFVEATGQDLVIEMSAMHEGSVPSGPGFAAAALARLGHMTGDEALLERVTAQLLAVGGQLEREPAHTPSQLFALDHVLRNVPKVAWHGRADDPARIALRKSLHATYAPFLVETGPGPVASTEASAVVCVGLTCLAPATDAKTLFERILEALDL